MTGGPAAGLLRTNPTFRTLWSAHAVSGLGDRFSMLALPVFALTDAGATPGQVALLWAVQTLPAAVLAAPIAAHLVGRPERRTMIACDLARMLLLGAVVGLAWLGGLRLWLLFLAVLLIGVAGTAHEVCVQSYLPRIVDRTGYAEANSRVAQATAAAEVAGPVLAGLLITFAGSAAALLVDAASFLASAVLLAMIRGAAAAAAVPAGQDRLWDRLRAGVGFVWRHRGLRALAAAFVLFNFGSSIVNALWLPYVLDGLGLSTSVIGALVTVGGVTALGAALAVRRTMDRHRPRVLLPVSLAGLVAALWLVPLAASGSPVLWLAGYQLGYSFALVYFRVSAATARQLLTPVDYQGRVYATVYAVAWLMVPAGGVVAGALAASTSLVTVMFAGALISSTSLLLVRSLAGLARPAPSLSR
ncbi:MAG TPA: MFS transporter [Actinophytocola sp.]|uniref:MFS transporter n=1 Tax=Actinophytocola sp. TaxID=1872138 RepID=UPI002DB7D20E|nr:MFS transporter [Actinophytocola sp.]HEU5471032.1 MFS transporter [Actinophytocola sp.]